LDDAGLLVHAISNDVEAMQQPSLARNIIYVLYLQGLFIGLLVGL
jgi:hypothetical protein